MIYIQEHIYDSEEIIKYLILQWRLFVIQKLTSSRMIGFMFIINYNYTMDALNFSISMIKQYFILSIYGQNKLLNKSFIQELSIKWMDIWTQGLFLHQ